MHDSTEQARITDAMHLLHLTRQFDCLPFPSISDYVAGFRYTDEPDAETAAASVRTAEGILSRQLGVTFEAHRPDPIGSAMYYQRTAKLPSGLWVYLTARAEVGPLLDAEDALDRVPVAA